MALIENTEGKFLERLVEVKRVTKVVKGGRIFNFTALTVVGDGKGKVGFGKGKGQEISSAMAKSLEHARRNMIFVDLYKGTIRYPINYHHCATTVIMSPAGPGTGVIAGTAMRAVLELVGIENILAKCIGSTNPMNIAIATFKGLQSLKSLKYIADKRGKTIEELLQ